MSIKTGLIKNTAFNLGGYVYLLFASFFSISLLLQNLGRENFGAFLLLSSIVPLLSVFDFGISTAVIRKLSLPSTDTQERNNTWQSSFLIFLVQATILSIVSVIVLLILGNTPALSPISKDSLSRSIVILSLTVFFNHLNTHFLSLPQANQRFDIFNSKTLLVGSANTVFAALLSFYFPTLEAIFLLQLIFHVFTTLFMVNYSYKFFLDHFWPKYDRKTVSDLFNFGVRNFIATLAGQVEYQFSKFALGSLVSASAVTAYSIPQNIVSKGAGVVSQIAQAVFPLSASLLEKDRIKKLKKLILILEMAVLVGGSFAVFLSFTIGEQFLTWWLKDPIVVSTALPVLQILSFYFVFASLTPIPTVLVQSIGKPQIPSFFAVLTTVIEIIIALILIPKIGVTGAAYGALVSSIITVPPFLIVCYSAFQKEIKRTQSLPYTQPPSTLS